MLGSQRLRELRNGKTDRGQWIPHLMRHPPGCLPERAKPFGFDFLGSGPLQASRHVTKSRTECREFRCAPTGAVRRKWLHFSDVPGPSNKLLDRPTKLA